jgi:hypothetical protein
LTLTSQATISGALGGETLAAAVFFGHEPDPFEAGTPANE